MTGVADHQNIMIRRFEIFFYQAEIYPNDSQPECGFKPTALCGLHPVFDAVPERLVAFDHLDPVFSQPVDHQAIPRVIFSVGAEVTHCFY